MKDVSDILAKRLLRLESPFSRDWLSDFSKRVNYQMKWHWVSILFR